MPPEPEPEPVDEPGDDDGSLDDWTDDGIGYGIVEEELDSDDVIVHDDANKSNKVN